MRSDDPFLLAEPPGWRIGGLLSSRNAVCVHAAQTQDGRPAVLKRLDLSTGDRIARLRFERERRLAQMLMHPGLAERLGEGEGWIGFEALPGHLADSAARFAAPDALLPLLAALAETLSYLHGRGIVHQDLKPAHILFRGDGRAVLVDLGAAGLMAADPLAGREAVGAPAWAAPEQLAGAPPSPAADLWSLARVALWLMGQTAADTLPAPLGPLLRRCLSLEPVGRPSAAGFVKALRSSSRFAVGPGAL